MEIKVLRKLIANPLLLNKRIKFYENKKIIQKVPLDLEEIKGHISKSEHNLKFVLDNPFCLNSYIKFYSIKFV